MLYCVVDEESIACLESEVMEKIAEGWIPVGGVGVAVYVWPGADEASSVYCQAMTKED